MARGRSLRAITIDIRFEEEMGDLLRIAAH
jgi:hypothetical protein